MVKPQAREATMNNNTMIRLMLTAALGIAVANVPSVHAQSTLGGAKQPQSKIGGVAKPAPVLGGATVHAYSPPPLKPPGPVVNLAKPGTPKPGATTPSPLAATNTRPNAAVMTPIPDKDGKVANLKCVSGACMSRGKQ